jgi:hypothetical protein
MDERDEAAPERVGGGLMPFVAVLLLAAAAAALGYLLLGMELTRLGL